MRTNDLSIVCKHSGITGTISLPAIPGKPGAALEYRHPLSFIEATLDVADQPKSYLISLDTTVLAGMYLTLLRNAGALQTKAHAATLNHLFSQAGKGVLVRSIKTLARYVVTLRNLNKDYPLPKLHPEALMMHLADQEDARHAFEINRWIAESTSTLAVEAADSGSIASFAKHLLEEGDTAQAALLTPVMLARQENKEAQQAELEAKLADIAAAKARAKERKSLDKALKVDDLLANEELDGLSLIEHQIRSHKLSHESLRTKLLDGFVKIVRATCKHLPAKQKQTLEAIGAALPTYDNDYIMTIVSKLEASTQDYAVIPHLLRCITLCDKRSITLEDELLGWSDSVIQPPKVTESKAKSEQATGKLSLRERLALRAAERKSEVS